MQWNWCLFLFISSGEAYRFCIHCRHHWKPVQRGIEEEPVSQCRLFYNKGAGTVDLVSGRRTDLGTIYLPCWVARVDETLCGFNGTLYETLDV